MILHEARQVADLEKQSTCGSVCLPQQHLGLTDQVCCFIQSLQDFVILALLRERLLQLRKAWRALQEGFHVTQRRPLSFHTCACGRHVSSTHLQHTRSAALDVTGFFMVVVCACEGAFQLKIAT